MAASVTRSDAVIGVTKGVETCLVNLCAGLGGEVAGAEQVGGRGGAEEGGGEARGAGCGAEERQAGAESVHDELSWGLVC